MIILFVSPKEFIIVMKESKVLNSNDWKCEYLYITCKFSVPVPRRITRVDGKWQCPKFIEKANEFVVKVWPWRWDGWWQNTQRVESRREFTVTGNGVRFHDSPWMTRKIKNFMLAERHEGRKKFKIGEENRGHGKKGVIKSLLNV